MFAAMDREAEKDDAMLMKIWGTVQELSDQLAHNQKLASSLQAQANSLKVRSLFTEGAVQT